LAGKAKNADDSYKKAVLKIVAERLKYFAELPNLHIFSSRFAFNKT
jgi:hypothetical protein